MIWEMPVWNRETKRSQRKCKTKEKTILHRFDLDKGTELLLLPNCIVAIYDNQKNKNSFFVLLRSKKITKCSPNDVHLRPQRGPYCRAANAGQENPSRTTVHVLTGDFT